MKVQDIIELVEENPGEDTYALYRMTPFVETEDGYIYEMKYDTFYRKLRRLAKQDRLVQMKDDNKSYWDLPLRSDYRLKDLKTVMDNIRRIDPNNKLLDYVSDKNGGNKKTRQFDSVFSLFIETINEVLSNDN